MIHVKDYDAYLRSLKIEFGDHSDLPSDMDILNFIRKYNLDHDWGITPDHVKEDIVWELLHHTGQTSGSVLETDLLQTDPFKNSISSYESYLQMLKETFGIPDKMPEYIEIQRFIDTFGLRRWEITVKDVCEDLRAFMNGRYEEMYRDAVPRQYAARKTKPGLRSISSYLQKLKETFGIPDKMPEYIEIQRFIDAFGLRRWEITVEDVLEDLTAFMDRYYEEMCQDASQNHTNIADNTPQAKCAYRYTSTYTPRIYRPARPTRPQSVCTFQMSAPAFPHQHTQAPGKHKTHEKNIRKKPKEIILIDGDNHFDEGRKGLENESEAKVLAFFSQPGAKKKFDKEYGGKPNISSKLVPPGNQAVDNQIKAMAGQLVKEPDQKVSIISQDKGFQKFAAKKNQHNTGDPIIVSRSVAKRKQRKKHKK